MRIILIVLLCMHGAAAQAQLYTLKDPTKDSIVRVVEFDTVPQLCDSFFIMLTKEKISGMSAFVPSVRQLRATFDTLDIAYREEQVIYRQQVLLRRLQKDYKIILKNAKKEQLKLSKLERKSTDYEYGQDTAKNEYCYVSITCSRKKKSYSVKFLAIKLNQHWYVGDELKLVNE